MVAPPLVFAPCGASWSEESGAAGQYRPTVVTGNALDSAGQPRIKARRGMRAVLLLLDLGAKTPEFGIVNVAPFGRPTRRAPLATKEGGGRSEVRGFAHGLATVASVGGALRDSGCHAVESFVCGFLAVGASFAGVEQFHALAVFAGSCLTAGRKRVGRGPGVTAVVSHFRFPSDVNLAPTLALVKEYFMMQMNQPELTNCYLLPNCCRTVYGQRFFHAICELLPDPLGKGNGSTVAEQRKNNE